MKANQLKPNKLHAHVKLLQFNSSMFWAPEHFGYATAWMEHGPFAFWLIETLRPKKLVELGTHAGYSYFCFCQAVQRLKLTTSCFAVDTWKGDEHAGFYDEDVFNSVTQINQKYQTFSKLVRSTFDDALDKFPAKSIDLLHIDGRHFYEDVKHDYESWLPKLTDDSIVLFHDTNVRERDFGAWKLYEELKDNHSSFEFLHGHGLGIIAPKKVPSALRQFFSSNQKDVQAIFASLGSAVLTKWSLQNTKYKLEEAMVVGGQMDKLVKEVETKVIEMKLLRKENSKLLKEQRLLRQELGQSIPIQEYQRLEKDLTVRVQSDVMQKSVVNAISKLHGEVLRSRSLTCKIVASVRSSLHPHKAKIEAINNSVQFDADWYLNTYLDVAKAGVNPAQHFLDFGAREGRDPGPFSSIRADKTKDVMTSHDSKTKNKIPSVTATAKGVRTTIENPRFSLFRLAENARSLIWGSNTHKKIQQRLNSSGIFDRNWYLEHNQDVSSEGMDPLIHYVRHGATEGRSTSEFFNTGAYLEQNPDVLASGINPLLHYLEHGAKEGRSPGTLFDAAWYKSEYPDVAKSGMNPLAHYLLHGRTEGRNPITNANAIDYKGKKISAGSASRFDYEPLISIITPVYNIAAKWLHAAVASVQAQSYANWELCICDDGSTNFETIAALAELERGDTRIRVIRSSSNEGIAKATNKALGLANGDFAAFLDNDDELVAQALEFCVSELNGDETIDILYSDEDKIAADGRYEEPFYKPDWSPRLLREVMYIGHFLVVRRTLIEESGGLDGNYDGVQDFELALRLSEKARKVHHIRKILYHWRRIPGSVAEKTDAKPGLGKLQAAAVNAHLKRTGVAAKAIENPKQQHRAILQPSKRTTWPKVSIIIPTKDAPQLIGRCLDSIFEKTSYSNIQVVVVDNDSTDREALSAISRHPVNVVKYHETFNYSRANNLGVNAADGEIIVLLNNDTEVTQADWIEQLLFFMDDPKVTVVGPKLLYPNGTVQHAGVALGMRGTADHVLRGLPEKADGYFGSLTCSREVSAVTFACAMMRRADYLAADGLEELFQSHYQDVDLCLRLRSKGQQIVYTPRARLVHHESATRGNKYNLVDRLLLLDRWGSLVGEGDPYSRWVQESRTETKIR
jgi:O-antigen biosynthesis protein